MPQDWFSDNAPKSGDDWFSQNAPRISPQMQMNRVLNASPTQFEIERDKSFQPGFLASGAQTLKNMLTPNPVSISGGGGHNPWQTRINQQETAQTSADQERAASGRSGAYREVAKLGSRIADVQGMEHASDVGNPSGVMGSATGSGAPLALPFLPRAARISAQAAESAVGSISDFAKAEGNPSALYHRYLDPVANAPSPTMPQVTPKVLDHVLNEVETLNPEAAQRIRNGQMTIGDKDLMRIRANKGAQSLYRNPGNYPAAMAQGLDDFGSALRDDIYPQIEKMNGLESGALGPIKELQGSAMRVEKNPTFFTRFLQRGLGSGLGASIGGAVAGQPGAEIGALTGYAAAEPVSQGIQKGIINLRTRALSSQMPEGGIVWRKQLPFPRTMPEVSSGPPNVPIFDQFTNPTTRAQRLGLLLPENTSIDLGPSTIPPDKPSPPPTGLANATIRKKLGLNKNAAGTGTGY